MNTRNLKLNDFEAFDRLIFRGKKPNWEKLYDPKKFYFYPPIPRPKTEVEYQLDHYALWMTIGHYGLTRKPHIFRRRGFRPHDALQPAGQCYACSWHHHVYSTGICSSPLYPCPLTGANGRNTCGPEWRKWNYLRGGHREHPERVIQIRQAARDIAHIKWRELT